MRVVLLPEDAAEEGLRLFVTAERAKEAYRDWLEERCLAEGFDPVADQITYSPATGRLRVVLANAATSSNATAPNLPPSPPLEGA